MMLHTENTSVILARLVLSLEGVGVPPARELLSELKEHEVPVYV